MTSLLNDLDEKAGKTAYQSYTLKHGIEKLTVLVPLTEATAFETEFNASIDKTKKSILEVVQRHSGKIRE